MFKKVFVISAVLFVFTIGASIASAQQWFDLGTKEVKDRAEQDTWHVGEGKGSFRFDQDQGQSQGRQVLPAECEV